MQTTTGAEGGFPLPQIKPPGLEPDPSGSSRASLSHCIPAGALLPQELLNSFEGDSVAVHLTNLLSPLPDLCVLPVLTQETKPAERTMNGKAPRRPRESKRRRCAFVVGEECGNVPAPCQTSLKGVRPHSAGVGKPGRDGAHTRRARLQLHRPIRGYMEEKKRRKKERKEKIQRRAWFWRAISRVCLCPMTPPSQSYTPSPPHTNLK